MKFNPSNYGTVAQVRDSKRMQQLHTILEDLRQKQNEKGGFPIAYTIQKYKHELQVLKQKYFKVI